MPDTFKEAKDFKEELLSAKVEKKLILKKKIAGSKDYEYYSLLSGDYTTIEGGYRIYWYLSSQKRRLDGALREKRIKKAGERLALLSSKLNKRDLKEENKIKKEASAILKRYGVEDFISIDIQKETEEIKKKAGRGRPGPGAQYKIEKTTRYLLLWEIDKGRLARQKRADGVFPLLATGSTIGPREVLASYKYQPRLEKRFNQLWHS